MQSCNLKLTVGALRSLGLGPQPQHTPQSPLPLRHKVTPRLAPLEQCIPVGKCSVGGAVRGPTPLHGTLRAAASTPYSAPAVTAAPHTAAAGLLITTAATALLAAAAAAAVGAAAAAAAAAAVPSVGSSHRA